MSLKEKMMLFNKPAVNEKELMIQQRKKASFTSKCAKFEGTKEPIMIKKDSMTKLKAKIFENGADEVDETDKEAEKLRKESFQKAKGAFQEPGDCEEEVVDGGSEINTSGASENEECVDDEDNEEQRQKRKTEFEAKQKLFNGSG